MTRILTEFQLAAHIAHCRATHGPDLPDSYFESVGNLAAVNSNQFHNPETGFLEFYADTPQWVRDLDKAATIFSA